MEASAIAKLLARPERTLSVEDRERLRPQLAGVQDPDANEDGSLKVWEPRDRARTPNIAAPKTLITDSWERAKIFAQARFSGMPLVIVGGGASALTKDLSLLDLYPTMGVNWTLKWFSPTYLHILDKDPFRSQVIESRPNQTYQAITSAQTLEWARNLGYEGTALSYAVKDDSCGKYPSFQLANQGSDMFQHFPNSLGYALQAGVALGYKKMILVGFDFGGFHFFGDGRSVGSANHYGAMGEMKMHLRSMLMAQAHYYLLNGIQVIHVGPTELKDCYPVVDAVEDIFVV